MLLAIRASFLNQRKARRSQAVGGNSSKVSGWQLWRRGISERVIAIGHLRPHAD